jgi:hypothetical protein
MEKDKAQKLLLDVSVHHPRHGFVLHFCWSVLYTLNEIYQVNMFIATDPAITIYMGKDKFESPCVRHPWLFIAISIDPTSDEDLIKYAWPQDVWFHVDKLSSAHVYLRMPEGMTWDKIPEAALIDCAQLVKANSIEGELLD